MTSVVAPKVRVARRQRCADGVTPAVGADDAAVIACVGHGARLYTQRALRQWSPIVRIVLSQLIAALIIVPRNQRFAVWDQVGDAHALVPDDTVRDSPHFRAT